MKLVYLAEDLRLAARPCALAEMVDSFTSPDLQQQAVAAFQREADMLAQLANEHIPRIFDRFSEANRHYLVMEYIDGTTLEDELRANGGKLPPAHVIDIALQILTTLEYLHNLEPPVIYRDLKPSNIMVTHDGQAKLIDFGIARHFAPLSNATMIGTQGYAPPEQYRGRVETRSDLYALGATMHHALSGRDPATEPPFSFPPLRKLCSDLDPSLAAVVDQALAYDVVNRIRDASEFTRRLIEIKAGAVEPAKPAPATANRTSARPQLPLPLGAAIRAAAGAAGQSSSSPSGQAVRSVPAASSVPSGTPTPAPQPIPAQLSPAPAASAPTVLSVSAEIKCPSCARIIPVDSRFCSYCAADLRHELDPFQLGHDPDAETRILGNRHQAQHASRNHHHRTQAQTGTQGSRRRVHRSLLMVAAILAISFIVARIIWNATVTLSPSADGSGSLVPPGVVAPGGDALGDRLTALRQALDDSGYTAVQFRMDGDTLELWGTVPSEFDRVTVQAIVFKSTGLVLLRDRIRVRSVDGEP